MSDKVEHNIDGASYNAIYNPPEPSLFCSCGFVAQGLSWEDAGALMDEHLDNTDDEGSGPA